ncbi:MAG TPA: hypothetical protein VKX17_00545 [Planctomycetota bacterium]|nr:hypothetical protein [Planctomycetota bacterium]
MSFYTMAGKTLEVLGMTVVAAALLAGMGIVDNNPSMAKEMVLLGIGSAIFTFGWWLDRSK